MQLFVKVSWKVIGRPLTLTDTTANQGAEKGLMSYLHYATPTFLIFFYLQNGQICLFTLAPTEEDYN